MGAVRKTRDAVVISAGVPSRRRPRGRRHSTVQYVPDRLAEDARIFVLVVERRHTTYAGALDGLIRDAFGSVDRLRVAAAAARAAGRPVAEVDLLERAADRAECLRPPACGSRVAT